MEQESLRFLYPKRDLKIIVAYGKNNEIGHKGKLPWPALKNDMNSFKTLTTHVVDQTKRNACIMGRKTYQSIPDLHRPLIGRVNIVLTKDPEIQIRHIYIKANNTTLIYVRSFDEALKYVDEENIESTFVIGGAEIYKLALESGLCKEIYDTSIESTFEADTFFPSDVLKKYTLLKTQGFEEKGYRYRISHRVLESTQ